MASGLEPIPIYSRKKDPGWAHCDQSKNGDRVQLKCKYCGKTFGGGGIHRMKEHLAGGNRSNAPPCPRVQPDVRRLMLENLNGSIRKKRKKPELLEEGNQQHCGFNTEAAMVPITAAEPIGMSPALSGRKKKEKVRRASAKCSAQNTAVHENDGPNEGSEVIKGQGSTVTTNWCNHGREIDSVSEAGEQHSSRRRDPAWKHCQVLKNGDREELKCVYCGKIFKGGGIHRIKEHLAGWKSDGGPICLRVNHEVRCLMQDSLNGIVSRKSKKHKPAQDISNPNPSSEVENCTNQRGLNGEVTSVSVPKTVNPNTAFPVNPEGGDSNDEVRKMKERVRRPSDSAIPNIVPINSYTTAGPERGNNEVNMAIGRFFYDVGLPLDAVNSVYFQQMLDTVASQGTGVAAPSSHELRSALLKNTLKEVKIDTDKCMATQGKTGCSILVDECLSAKGRTMINFLMYCPQGTTFLRSVDISDYLSSSDALFDFFKDVVEEVGVRNVLQLVTNSEERYAAVAKRLKDAFPTIFWTPCAACCIDLILKDFGKNGWISTILERAKSISRFIYNHAVVLNMMRRYTSGVDLIVVGRTRVASDFSTLKQMVSIKSSLQSMFTSEEWMECQYSKKHEGLAVLDHISSQSFWSSCLSIVHLTNPLLRLLRLVSSETRPAMGYIYAGFYRVKESIKKKFVDEKEYLRYWDIIDRRWGQLLRHPLHPAGFYLNPRFFYSTEEEIRNRMRSSVFDCIEKLVPDPEVQDKIALEITSYDNAAGDFGRPMAIRARDTLLPGEWWSSYGGSCPNLARLAIRILSQTCSLTWHKLNLIYTEQMHETKNCIERQRLGDLVFVQHNLQLKHIVRNCKEQDSMDPLSHPSISTVEEWVVQERGFSEDPWGSDWIRMTDSPILYKTMLLQSSTDDVDDMGTGFDDREIFDGTRYRVEENGKRQ